ncbi:hypothetical protein ACJMK2_018047 [Sinanodonta woodiana]|uniref:Uncharacterized protein n=1 Tax=Sinanodonta woodiana TaxID=1069815 RepID=A0ABD3UFU3_SINWO
MTVLTVFALQRTSMNKEMDMYAQLVFIEGDIRFEDSSHPIPNWPFQSLESLLKLDDPVSSGTMDYFRNLTTGQFLYSLTVKKESICGSQWYEIMTMWFCNFTNSLLECFALCVLYNRCHRRFTEIQKRFHVRGDIRVKDTMILFLNSKIVLPTKKNAISDSQQYEILDHVSQMEGGSSNELKKINITQATGLKKKTAALCTVEQENKMLRNLVNKKSKQLKMIGPESKSIQNEKTRLLRDLKVKLKLQQHEMDTVNTEMSSLSKVASNVLESLDEKENESQTREKVESCEKVLFNTRKKVQRRNRNMCELHEKVKASRNKFKTDKKSTELYFTGTVDSLTNLHKLSVDSLYQRLEEIKQLVTKKGEMYKGQVRLLYYDLLTLGVSANTVQSVVKHTAQIMVSETGVKIRTAYELSREKSTLCPKQFTELHNITDQLEFDHDDFIYANQWQNLKANMEDASVFETNVYAFTCAAHKLNNMAVAMTDHSTKYFYLCDSNTNASGMLLSEHSQKEYGLGSDFKAYSLCSEIDTGSELFRPIIGNRYLIFLQNAIPSLAAHNMVLIFLEDIKDANDNTGLNRLEYSVQQGYLNDNVQADEIAFSILYAYLCAPLLQKAKTVKSPLEMNQYYASAVGTLGDWCRDPSGLVAGIDLLWEGAMGPAIHRPYMTIICQMARGSDLVLGIIKVKAKAGQEKLRSHEEEHLYGGLYAVPTHAMVKAANTFGDATNDRIESFFGMLDRQMIIAPDMNHVIVASLIAAKQDKAVEWIKSANIPPEKICSVAMKHAKLERQEEGTNNGQIKRRFMEGKFERDAKI